MSKSFSKIIKKKLGKEDVLFSEYKPFYHLKEDEIIYSKVRGNVRLYLKQVLTAFDIQKMINHVLSIRLP